MRIVHVITSLETGGAQTFLLRLLERLPEEHKIEVISLTDYGPIGEQIAAHGVRVHTLGMKPGRPDLKRFLRLVRLLRASKPDLVHTWMYHADLAGGLAAVAAGVPCIWCIRLAYRNGSSYYRPSVMLVVKACAAISGLVPKAIVCCGELARQSHEALGYACSKLVVIPNGIDTEVFRPRPEKAAVLRRELLVDSGPVIGMVGRHHPQKNHEAFFAMAAKVHARFPGVKFVLVGPGVTGTNVELAAMIARYGVGNAIRLLGEQQDMAGVMSAFDLLVSPSLAEGFPNVLAEAMATGTPCVATDVGDTAAILGAEGRVVPPGDVEALTFRVLELLEMSASERQGIGRRARDRVKQMFALDDSVSKYLFLYNRIVGANGPR